MMNTRVLKEFIENYRVAEGMSVSDGEQIYLEMLEYYMDNREYFENEFAEIKAVVQEWTLNN